jgi:hypothetical protein
MNVFYAWRMKLNCSEEKCTGAKAVLGATMSPPLSSGRYRMINACHKADLFFPVNATCDSQRSVLNACRCEGKETSVVVCFSN